MSIINSIKLRKESKGLKEIKIEIDINCSAIFELDGKAYSEQTYKTIDDVQLTDNEINVLETLFNRLEKSYKEL